MHRCGQIAASALASYRESLAYVRDEVTSGELGGTLAANLAASLHERYAVTWPLHGRYMNMTVTWPLHGRYMTGIWPLHDRYMAVT